MGKSGYTIKKNKNNYSFTYSGDLSEAIEKAKKDLHREQDNQEVTHWLWLKAKADRALKDHTDRITRLQAFIKCAEENLQKMKTEGKE